MQHEQITITANERLARHRRMQHAVAQREHGAAVCEPAPVWSWNGWLRVQYARLQDVALAGLADPPPALLTGTQADALWENIVGDSAQGASLLQLPATATAVRDAWTLARAWGLPLEPPELGAANDIADVAAFYEWARAFRARCRVRDWLDGAELADCLRHAVASGKLTPPGRIELLGFDELTPQQRELCAALEETGCWVTRVGPPAAADPGAAQLACSDAGGEIRAAADWAARCLSVNPKAHIGIVVPDLRARRAALCRALDECLTPARRLDAGYTPAAYNISLGDPLAAVPLIHTALLALGLASGPLDSAQAGALLRSPYLAGAEAEAGARARLDRNLRRRGLARLGMGVLADAAGTASGCPELARILGRARSLQAAWPGRQSPSSWVAALSSWLAALGWLRGRPLDSVEYQAHEAWRQLLSGCASLTVVNPQCRAGEAVARLKRMAREAVFQPQTPAAQVEVLGPLEASGLLFDHLWVMGLHDGVWPAAPQPNPFLPVRWQREAGVPHSSAARELDFAEKRTAGFRAAAPEVIFSWPQRDGDAELRPSPLIARLQAMEAIAPPAPLARLWYEMRAREAIPDSHLPTVPIGTRTAGGSSLLADQAACSFRAAAVHRWHAEALEQPADGLDARTRGTLVHRIMAAIWTGLHSRARLAALGDEERVALVGRCVASEIDRWCLRNPGLLDGRFRAVEENRLAGLALQWLTLELARGDFEVEPAETDQEFDIGGLRLRGRPDRIDRLPDGHRLIVDYKTGRHKPGEWLGERPDSPQLPLYALANREQLAGVLIATLRTGSSAYGGVTRNSEVVPGVPGFDNWRLRPAGCATFDDLLDYWQQILAALAERYRAGEVRVDPKQPPQTCQYCHLSVLCRIDELRGVAQDLEEVGGDD